MEVPIMNHEKIGTLIYTLRKEKGLTQKQLSECIRVSDKAISKWEHGRGCPDLSLLPELSNVLGVNLEELLTGELDANMAVAGNLKKIQFYVCPICGNFLTAARSTNISCCGRKLLPLTPQKAEKNERLSIETIETEFFISSDHVMTRKHFISFVAFLTGDTVILRKLYPEWDLQTRIPFFKHGMLIWYCTQHGLFYQII
jgi:transcriptional regulator with XRE-family HTH domain/desulfoferrodoxin (superoxide reductase-like protein)